MVLKRSKLAHMGSKRTAHLWHTCFGVKPAVEALRKSQLKLIFGFPFIAETIWSREIRTLLET
jgi:hypothetical protein